jgi:hypothetical protein
MERKKGRGKQDREQKREDKPILAFCCKGRWLRGQRVARSKKERKREKTRNSGQGKEGRARRAGHEG